MGCVFSFRMAPDVSFTSAVRIVPDVSFTSAADAPRSCWNSRLPRWFCIYDAKVRKISDSCKLFSNFFFKKYTKGTVLFVYFCVHV